MQEVAGDDGVGLGCEELPPRRALTAGCWVDAGRVKDVPDGRCSDGVAEAGEFAVDAAVSPSGVLGGQAQDELSDHGMCWWSARSGTSPGVVPFSCDESAVPRQQGRGCDREDRRPSAAGDERGQGCQPEPIRGAIPRTRAEFAAQDRVLVSQDEQLGVLGAVAAQQYCRDRKQLAGQVVEQRHEHPRIVSARLRGALTSDDEYLSATGCGNRLPGAFRTRF